MQSRTRLERKEEKEKMEPETLNRTLHAIVGVALLISVVTDLYRREIKDFVTYPTLVICLLLRGIFGGAGSLMESGFLSGFAGMIIGGLVFRFFSRKGAVGMGDVKLLAAVGAGVGVPTILFCFIGIGLFGGIHSLVLLIWRGEFFFTLKKLGLRFAGSS